MQTIINLKISLETLTEAISSLSLAQKQELLEILEQKIFEEEATYQDTPETIAELETIRAEYKKGDYITLDEYTANKSSKLLS